MTRSLSWGAGGTGGEGNDVLVSCVLCSSVLFWRGGGGGMGGNDVLVSCFPTVTFLLCSTRV